MSLKFNNTSSPYDGIIQQIEDELGFNRTDISSVATKLADWTSRVNLAFDSFWAIALPATGKWQLDDSNQSDYPVIKTNLVDGQRDYTFTTDGSGNLILDIYKVAVLPTSTATLYQTIYPIDVQSDEPDSDLLAENTTEGIPFQYEKMANGILLDPIPSYNATNGLKMYINREASFFTISDTTKKPGVPGDLHEWFVVEPCLKYAGRKSLSNYGDLLRRREELKQQIIEVFSKRDKDDRPVMFGEFNHYE